MGTVVWVDGPPEFEIDGDGVRIVYRSGGTSFTNRMSRASFRAACECGIRMLDAADRGAVVAFPSGAACG